MAYIYAITNLVNNKQYVGKTSLTLEQRWRRHIQDSQRDKISNRPLYRAFHKYGIDNFRIEELEQCEEDEASDREQFWIKELNTYAVGYNATLGGEGRAKNDYEKIFEYWQEGHSSKDVQQKFGIGAKSVQIALDLHNIPLEERIAHGNTFSSKLKECGGKSGGRKKTPVIMCDLETKEELRAFESKADALRFLGKYPTDSAITKVCKGERQSAFGYFWKFG